MSVGLVTIALWIVMAGVGAVVSAINLKGSYDDLKHQLRARDRRWQRTLIAKVNISYEVMRFVVLVLLFIAGVLVAWVQFNPDPPPASLYVRCVILLTIAILVTQTLVNRWFRHRLTRPHKEAPDGQA